MLSRMVDRRGATQARRLQFRMDDVVRASVGPGLSVHARAASTPDADLWICLDCIIHRLGHYAGHVTCRRARILRTISPFLISLGVGFLIAGIIYIIRSLVVFRRNHPDRWIILVINLTRWHHHRLRNRAGLGDAGGSPVWLQEQWRRIRSQSLCQRREKGSGRRASTATPSVRRSRAPSWPTCQRRDLSSGMR